MINNYAIKTTMLCCSRWVHRFIAVRIYLILSWSKLKGNYTMNYT